MTLRQYYAAAALQGILASPTALVGPLQAVREALEAADIMIAEESK